MTVNLFKKTKPLKAFLKHVQNEAWSYRILDLVFKNDVVGLKKELDNVEDITYQLNFPSLYYDFNDGCSMIIFQLQEFYQNICRHQKEWITKMNLLDSIQLKHLHMSIKVCFSRCPIYESVLTTFRPRKDIGVNKQFLNAIGISPTPLVVAILSCASGVIDLLLEIGVDISIYDILLALENCNNDIFLKLLMHFKIPRLLVKDCTFYYAYSKQDKKRLLMKVKKDGLAENNETVTDSSSTLSHNQICNENVDNTQNSQLGFKNDLKNNAVYKKCTDMVGNYGYFQKASQVSPTVKPPSWSKKPLHKRWDRVAFPFHPAAECLAMTAGRTKFAMKYLNHPVCEVNFSRRKINGNERAKLDRIILTENVKQKMIKALNVRVFCRTLYDYTIRKADLVLSDYLLTVLPWPKEPYDYGLLDSFLSCWPTLKLFTLITLQPTILQQTTRIGKTRVNFLEMIVSRPNQLLFSLILNRKQFHPLIQKKPAKNNLSLLQRLCSLMMTQQFKASHRLYLQNRHWLLTSDGLKTALDSFRILIQFNFDVSRLANGKSLLHMCLENPPIKSNQDIEALRLEAVELLIAAGIDINQKYANQSPLHMAAKNNLLGCCKALIDAGADTVILNGDNKSVLDVCDFRIMDQLDVMLNEGCRVLKLSHLCLQQIRKQNQVELLGNYMKSRF
ncbi:hypothetical protein BC833DRAFT_578673 [Globomyces pollinis-pini]|nr:hypothetical protein BC833DRAFT_578673 [Globomyces pollinis-pini]